MPFLLVIIAIFLGAFFTTYQIGNVAINTTCNLNAADACTLAASSTMAWILNFLHIKIAPDMKNTSSGFKNNLKAISISAVRVLSQAQNKINLAKTKAQQALAQINSQGETCTIWSNMLTASENLRSAIRAIQLVNESLLMARKSAVKMKASVKEFEKLSDEYICGMIRDIKKQYDDAKRKAAEHAFENNCVFRHSLSPEQQQQALDKIDKIPNDPEKFDASAAYSWKDSNGNNNSMSASVTLPEITSIDLEVTQKNKPCDLNLEMPPSTGADPYGINGLAELRTMLKSFTIELSDYSKEAKKIYEETVSAHNLCQNGNEFEKLVGREKYIGIRAEATSLYVQLKSPMSLFNTIAEQSIKTLRNQYQKIPKWLGPQAGTPRIISTSPSFCGAAKDVLILGIRDVKFKSGCANCDVSMDYAGNSSSSTSTSTPFGGGKEGYTSGSMSTSLPNNHYVPRALSTNGSCPGNGGASIGPDSGPSFNHVDESCGGGSGGGSSVGGPL